MKRHRIFAAPALAGAGGVGWALAAGLLAVLFLTAALLPFTGCSLDDDPLNIISPGTGDGDGDEDQDEENPLDERLYGLWRWQLGGIREEFSISRTPRTSGNLGSLTYGSLIWEDRGFEENFGGDIVYAQSFSKSAGVLIIEYWSGHKQGWIDWDKATPPYELPLRKDQPAGNFYGIYFINLNSAGTQVFLANTNDQKNNYGPTETSTLAQAIAKFTQGNMNQLLDLSVGDPQTKVEDR